MCVPHDKEMLLLLFWQVNYVLYYCNRNSMISVHLELKGKLFTKVPGQLGLNKA